MTNGLGPALIALVPAEERAAVLAALRLGAEVVRTPVDTEELLARMARCLHERQRLNELSPRGCTPWSASPSPTG